MNTSDAVVRSAGLDATPLPAQLGEQALPRIALSPPDILAWIAAAQGQPWFPSQHAAATGTDRDSLDNPIAELRLAGLIRVATWMKGVGQGYVLTSEGEEALASGRIPGQVNEPPSDTYPALQSLQLPLDVRPSVAVPALLIANVLWFFVTLILALRAGDGFWSFMAVGDPAIQHRLGSLAGIDLLRGEWWRLLTCCFVHAGAIHLAVNLFSLAIVGPLAEAQWGRRHFAAIYLLSCLGGSCLAVAINPSVSVVGASGGICGVVFAVGVWFWTNRSDLTLDEGAEVARRLVVAVLAIIGLSLMPGISWEAHLGGSAAGFLAAVTLTAANGVDRYRRLGSGVLLLALPLVMIGGLIGYMDGGRNWQALKARMAEEKTRQAVLATTTAFDANVAPLLAGLSQDAVAGVQRLAMFQLALPKARRDPGISDQVLTLKARADLAAERIDALAPIGVETIDLRLSQAREFAEARSRSMGLLLEMFAADRPPTSSQMDAWADARRHADQLDTAVRTR